MPHTKEELLRLGIEPRAVEHNQHRRAEWLDYGSTGLYMVTMCVEGRKPVFGHLVGNWKATRDSKDFPHIVLSPLAQRIIEEELPKISYKYPQVEVWQVAFMPDHIHLLIYIRTPLPKGKHLGHIIGAFKGGCSRQWWKGPEANATGTAAKGPEAYAAGTAAGGPEAYAAGTAAGGPEANAAGTAAGVPTASAVRCPLFEEGYHDRIIKRPGMLEVIKRYMSDNPLRAIMRRSLPNLLERRLHLRIGTHDYAAFGCIFLLKRAEKEQVFYHRKERSTSIPTEETEAFHKNRIRQLSEARQGVVLVSPAISKGERIVINDAINEGLPVIQLQKEPISQYWKPELRRFEACSRGTLLILSPWELDEEIAHNSPVSDFARFHHLNDLAAEICATTDCSLLGFPTHSPQP